MTNTDPGTPASRLSGILSRESVDWDETPPSVAIVLAMEELGESPLALPDGSTLSEYVDPDALDALVTHCPGRPTAVSIEIGQFRVDIEGTELYICDRTETAT